MTTRLHFKTALMSCSAALAIVVGASGAYAADLPSKAVAPAPPVPTFALFDGVEFHAQGEAGIYGNSGNPGNGQNIGQLYTDRANTPLLNQILFTAIKAIDPKATDYAFGFTVQGVYGSDERYNHVLGLGAYAVKGRNQIGLYNAFIAGHLPWLTPGGVDVKVGVFTSPQGFETFDPSTTPFYSHSYIWNYSLAVLHTGILTTTHVNDTLDVYLGIDTGNLTSFGTSGDNNSQPAGYAGIGLNNLLDNKLTVVALTHIGPENASCRTYNVAFGICDPNANKDLRYYNVVDFTYKFNDDWTGVLEGNYTHDDFGTGQNAYGGAAYLTYAYSKQVSLNLRGEIFRDANGFFVAGYPGNLDAVNLQRGLPNTAFGFGPETYSELTLGLTYKPDVPKPLALLQIRPEVRYDRSLSGVRPFNPTAANIGTSRDSFTFGGDVTIGF